MRPDIHRLPFISGKAGPDGFTTDDGLVLPAGTVPPGVVTYGIRPEDLVPHSDGLEVEVVVVEPTGPEIHIVGHPGRQSISAVIRDRIDVKPGDRIRLLPRAARAHFYGEMARG